MSIQMYQQAGMKVVTPHVFKGTTEPLTSLGRNGDIYIRSLAQKLDSQITCEDTIYIYPGNSPYDLTYSVIGDGNFNASINDSSIATMNIYSGYIMLEYESEGNTTLTLSVSATDNYNAATKTVNVVATAKVPLVIAPFSTATDEQIVRIINGIDTGEITADQTGWQVGDERRFYTRDTNGRAIWNVMTIIDYAVLDLETPTAAGRTKCSFVIGWICLNGEDGGGTKFPNLNYVNATDGKIYQTNETLGNSWEGSQARNVLNYASSFSVYGLMPQYVKDILKKFKVVTAQTYTDDSPLQETYDYLAYFAEKEIIGEKKFSPSSEAAALKQFEYFKDPGHRIIYGRTQGNWASYDPSLWIPTLTHKLEAEGTTADVPIDEDDSAYHYDPESPSEAIAGNGAGCQTWLTRSPYNGETVTQLSGRQTPIFSRNHAVVGFPVGQPEALTPTLAEARYTRYDMGGYPIGLDSEGQYSRRIGCTAVNQYGGYVFTFFGVI